MRPINSPDDFAALLREERAVLLLFFPWSDRAIESRAVVQEWETKLASQPGQNIPAVYQLAPDDQPYTWKWANEVLGDSDEATQVNGCVLWLKQGSVVGRVNNAATAGVKLLSRITNDCFVRGAAATDWLPNETARFEVELLEILCCPETHQKLKLATQPLLKKINQQISTGRLQNRSGQAVGDAIDGGLVRADGRYLYPLRLNIPVLLMDEAIPLAGF
jgi:uncharacterized protein YbaR (Trm112 family)